MDDIKAVRQSDFINNFWRGLANDPGGAEAKLGKSQGGDGRRGALDPVTRELIYIAVSTANSCSYCIHSHTAAARQKGITDAQHAQLLAVIGMASQTNNLVTAMQIPVDKAFLVGK